MMGRTHYSFGALFAAAGAPIANHVFDLGLSPADLTVGVGIGMIAGVLPDIDHPDSLVTKGLLPGRKMFGRVGKMLGWWLSIPPRFVGVGARQVGNHRGPTHTLGFLLGWTLLAAPLYAAQIALAAVVGSFFLNALSGALIEPLTPFAFNLEPGGVLSWLIAHTPAVMPLVMLTVGLGYLSHLFSDSLTKVPIPFWWPLRPLKKRSFFPLMPKTMRVTTDSATENRLIRPVVVVLAVICYLALIGIPLVNDVVAGGKQQAAKVSGQVRKTRDRAPIIGPLHSKHNSKKH